MEDNLVRVDGVKWHCFKKEKRTGGMKIEAEAICPDHSMKLTPTTDKHSVRINGQSIVNWSDGQYLYCDEEHIITIPRVYSEEKSYVIKRLEAINFSKLKVINLDDEAIPIAKDRINDENDRYFITSRLMRSKRGLQAVIYAGRKNSSSKTQIFTSPDEKRLSFDHKDLHPTEIFLKIEATFDDGSKQSIEK